MNRQIKKNNTTLGKEDKYEKEEKKKEETDKHKEIKKAKKKTITWIWLKSVKKKRTITKKGKMQNNKTIKI